MKHFTFYHASDAQAAIEADLAAAGAPRTRVVGGSFFYGDGYVPELTGLQVTIPPRAQPGDIVILDHEPRGFMAAIDGDGGAREIGLLCAIVGAAASFGLKPIVYGPWIGRGMNSVEAIADRWQPVAHAVADYGGGLMMPTYCPPGDYDDEQYRKTSLRVLEDGVAIANRLRCDVYPGLWRWTKADRDAPRQWDLDVADALLGRNHLPGLIFFGIGLERKRDGRKDDTSVSLPWAREWIKRVERMQEAEGE